MVSKMSDCELTEKGIGEQLYDYLKVNPKDYDVTFFVGPEKTAVRAVKVILKATSPIFKQEFNDKWEKAVLKDGEGIPLPDLDPSAFELFIKLLISNTWSTEALDGLNLSMEMSLNLLKICRRFQVRRAIKQLEKIAIKLMGDLHAYIEKKEFLELSRENLESILSSYETLEEKFVFDSACRWAEFQCTQSELEPTGENMRQIIGPCLFEIRFTTMSIQDFSKVCRFKKGLLSPEEKSTIFEFMGMDEDEKLAYDLSQIPFKVHPRKFPVSLPNTFEGSTLCLTKNLQIGPEPPFICNGLENINRIQISNGKIALHGIGFFGPIDEDSYYDVTIKIKTVGRLLTKFSTGTLQKRLFGQKQKIFYFIFDEPITLEPIQDEPTWNGDESYGIFFTLKGPNTMAVQRSEGSEGPIEEQGIKFRFYWARGKNQCAEYLYKKL